MYIRIKAVKIPCRTRPTWSHFIQDKLKLIFTCPWTNIKKVNSILYFDFFMNSLVVKKAVWILSSWLLKKLADGDLHCLQNSSYLVQSVFTRVCMLFQNSKVKLIFC